MSYLKSTAVFRIPEMSARGLWRQRRHLLPTLMAAAIGMTLSTAAWFVVSLWETRHADLEFNAVAETHYRVLQNGINEYLNKLLTLVAKNSKPLRVLTCNPTR
jgi:CHASE1-domain containing sensor protein